MSSKKISHDDDHLDLKKLEEEVQTAVVNDERYWRENDAKIRAVEQRVPTYDDFRELVLAAHLKPLEKEDKMNNIKNFTQIWNQPATLFPKSNIPDNIQNENEAKSDQVTVNSGQEFAQYWKRYCKTHKEKKAFLLSVGASKLQTIFKVEIAGGLLGEFIECLYTFEDHEAQLVANCLESLSKSQRFSLSKTFLSKHELELCTLLLDKLVEKQNKTDDIQCMDKLKVLRNIYC
ncbi:coiled-coil domain-containing protein 103 [Biomphalaria glabrata]|nr:coiled-coil domain-containing protein 103-like [Biomphalaria glabrata]